MLESWRHCWRVGVAPLLSTESLEALRVALDTDDKRLIQKATTDPPPLQSLADWPVQAACPVAFCGTNDLGGFDKNADGTPNAEAATVQEAEEFFAKLCFSADQRLGEPGAIRWFLNAVDDWKRQEMRENLLPEVLRSLQRRAEGLPDDEGQGAGAA